MMNEAAILNPGLYRIHRVLFVAYFAFFAIFALIGVLALMRPDRDPAIGLLGLAVLPIAAVHWYAANGARTGQPYGRTLSLVIAALMVFGFPLGTAIAIYIFTKIGKRWQNAPTGA